MLTNFCWAAAGADAMDSNAVAKPAAASVQALRWPKGCLTDVVMQTPYGVFPRDLPVFAGGRAAPRACGTSCANHHAPARRVARGGSPRRACRRALRAGLRNGGVD